MARRALRTRARTYRIAIEGFTPLVDLTFELANPAASGIHAEVTYHFIHGTATYWTVQRNSSAATGGTSAALTITPVDSQFPAATITGKSWSVAKTGGAAGNLSFGRLIANSSGVPLPPPLQDAAPVTINPGEWLAFIASAANAGSGYIEFTEKPL